MADNPNFITRSTEWALDKVGLRFASAEEMEKRTGGIYTFGDGGFASVHRAGSDKRLLQSITGLAALRIIANGVSGLKVETLKKDGEGNFVPSKGTISELFNVAPNESMTAHDFISNLFHDYYVHGAGYARIERNDIGQVTALYYLPCNAVEVLSNGDLKVDVVNSRGHVLKHKIKREDAFIFSNLRGEGLLKTHADLFELEQFCVQDLKTFYRKGSKITTVVHSPKLFSQQQKQSLKASMKRTSGPNSADSVVLMDGVQDLRIEKLSVTPADAGTTDILNDTQRAIATVFGVPGGMLNQQVVTTFSNASQQRINLVNQTIEPLVHALEDAIHLQLMTPAQRKKTRINFDTAPLLKGDSKTQAEVHSIYYHGGILTANDIRKDLGLSPIEGGDTLHTPLNLGDAAEGYEEDNTTSEDDTTLENQ